MSEGYKSFRTVSSVNKDKKRPNSAKSSTTMVAMQKREKLKNLLIEKFIKKFSAEEHKIIIETEVSDFIKQEKLTEIDLKNFEKVTEEVEKKTNNYTDLPIMPAVKQKTKKDDLLEISKYHLDSLIL